MATTKLNDERGDAPDGWQTAAPVAATPGVTVSIHAARTALRMAEQAVEEINKRLWQAETDRDYYARNVGRCQEQVEQLIIERELRTKHVRELMAATQDGH